MFAYAENPKVSISEKERGKEKKYLGVISQNTKDMYAKNYKTLTEEIKYLNKWRHTVFKDWKTQPSKDFNSPQIDIHV